jgi:hypothetical protein
MIDNCRRYILEYEVLVVSHWDTVYAVSNGNFGSAGKKDSEPDCLQRPSFSQELQDDPDVILIIAFIKCVDDKNI